MKVEVGSFTPQLGGNTLFLNDDTLTVSSLFFQVSKNGVNVNGSTGFTDGIKNRGKYVLDDTIKSSGRSTSYSVYQYANVGGVATQKLAGKCAITDLYQQGQFGITFDVCDMAYTIDFIAFGN